MTDRTPLPVLDRLAFLGLSGTVVAVALFQGLQVLRFRLDLVVLVVVVIAVQAFVSQVTFTAFVSASAALLLGRLALAFRQDAPVPTDEVVTAIVPVYRDAAVLDASVESLLAATQPVEVLVVAEPDDEASIRRARELANRERVDWLVNRENPGSKAGAVNAAVERVETDYLAVFDADEAVDPDLLAAAVETLDGGADVVQGRTVPRAEGPVESLAYYESALLSYAGRRLLYLATGFRMAASRCVVVRRSALSAVGGYDPSMLTEDYYFAHRCYCARLDVREQLRYPSTIEAAHSLPDWWGQRKRWMTGYAQVFATRLRESTPPRHHRDLVSLGVCAGTVIGNVFMLSLVAKFLAMFLVGDGTVTAVPLAVLTGVAALVRCVDYGMGTVDRVGIGWLLAPLVFPLYALAATKALTEYVFSWSGEWYRVEKRA